MSQVNCGIGAAAATVTLPNRNFLPTVRTAGNHRPHLVVNAKSSTQADMLEKDSVSVEGVDDKSGKTPFLLCLCMLFVVE